MIGPFRFATARILFALMIVLAPALVVAQEYTPEVEGHATEEAEFHRNHFGAFLGVSRHSDLKDRAITLGVEYARVFSPRWGASAYLEMVGGELERDLIVIVAGIFYPMRGLGIVLGPGIEKVNKDVEHNGEVVQEQETELIIRGGIAYGFHIAETASLGPTIFADWSETRWTFVYGISWVVGF